MSWQVKEVFATLQGEGAQTGRAAVFMRFAGCNLWSGREQDRARAICRFCDTDFVGTDGSGGGRFDDAAILADHARRIWESMVSTTTSGSPLVVCTGGEPLLQLDRPLIAALHARGFAIAVETNGTLPAPEGLDWICVSPKSTAALALQRADELKLVYPQTDALPEQFEQFAADHFFLQPMDGPQIAETTRAAIDYCLSHPQWRLSLQTHKFIGLP